MALKVGECHAHPSISEKFHDLLFKTQNAFMKPRGWDMTLKKWEFFIYHAQSVIGVIKADNAAGSNQREEIELSGIYLPNCSSMSVRYLQRPLSAAI